MPQIYVCMYISASYWIKLNKMPNDDHFCIRLCQASASISREEISDPHIATLAALMGDYFRPANKPFRSLDCTRPPFVDSSLSADCWGLAADWMASRICLLFVGLIWSHSLLSARCPRSRKLKRDVATLARQGICIETIRQELFAWKWPSKFNCSPARRLNRRLSR